MDKIRLTGGRSLRGEIEAGGSKNAALPILISTLLTADPVRLTRVPLLEDIGTTAKILEHLGAHVSRDSGCGSMDIEAKDPIKLEAPYDLVRKMRASVLVLGPLVARFGEAKVSLPGGCAIGARPVNFHLTALEALGVEITLENGYVHARTKSATKRLQGAKFRFPFPSVGATENTLMAACLADGETVLENCAREPEIEALAQCLRMMGAEISGEGSETIRIRGKKSLHGGEFAVPGDRIEAGTYLAAALATRGDVLVRGIHPLHLEAVLLKFEETGAQVERLDHAIRVVATRRSRAVDVTTAPYPGFPTDMQAQFMTAMALSEGTSTLTETIFENRFMHVPELSRMGADIVVRGNQALVRGKAKLLGAPVMATDLRASASLVIAGLAAEGETTVNRVYHLDRGYERLEEKLRQLGADAERVK